MQSPTEFANYPLNEKYLTFKLNIFYTGEGTINVTIPGSCYNHSMVIYLYFYQVIGITLLVLKVPKFSKIM